MPHYSHYGPVSMPMHMWMRDQYPLFEDKTYECVQEAGDVFYVPSRWHHAVLNLKYSVGVAVEVGESEELLENLMGKAIHIRDSG